MKITNVITSLLHDFYNQNSAFVHYIFEKYFFVSLAKFKKF